MKWYELDEKDRIKNIYSKYKIKDFWEFWSSGNRSVMEVRIKDWETIKKVGSVCNIYYSYSGVYLYNDILLKKVIAMVRDEHTVWFGINPRRRNFNDKGWKVFGGKDVFVESISFLFIDIDRVRKIAPASKEELMACDEMAELILERLGEAGWNKSYAKIASGNGVQLLIKLDIPIMVPNVKFDLKTKTYMPNLEFEEMKRMIRDGIGKQIVNFARRHKDKLMVDVDKLTMNMGRVGALPMTKNFKYDSFTWRAVVDIKDGVNEGLSDYILSSVEDLDKFKRGNVFTGMKLSKDSMIRKGKFLKHPLVRFMLDYDFPMGGINNTLWFTLKIIIRDSKYDTKTEEFRKFHAAICKKHGRSFSLNLPGKEHEFSTGAVNNFCINNCFPIIFEKQLWESRALKLDMKIEGFTFEAGMRCPFPARELSVETTIVDDMESAFKEFVQGDYSNADRLGAFTKGTAEKYGMEKAEYFFKNLFYRYFSFGTRQ